MTIGIVRGNNTQVDQPADSVQIVVGVALFFFSFCYSLCDPSFLFSHPAIVYLVLSLGSLPLLYVDTMTLRSGVAKLGCGMAFNESAVSQLLFIRRHSERNVNLYRKRVVVLVSFFDFISSLVIYNDHRTMIISFFSHNRTKPLIEIRVISEAYRIGLSANEDRNWPKSLLLLFIFRCSS